MPNLEAQKTYALFDSAANKKLITEIKDSGANLILFPAAAVSIEAAELTFENKSLLENISEFDWVIFQNVFSVDYFLLALEKIEIDFFELDALRVCAFGETVADRLRFSQVHADVISNSAETRNVLLALENYEPDLNGLKILIPAAFNKQSKISESLKEAGAKVTEIGVYLAEINDTDSRAAKLKALLKGGAIDEFIFSTPEEVAVFAFLFQTENFSDLLDETTRVSATGVQALTSLREFGLNRVALR